MNTDNNPRSDDLDNVAADTHVSLCSARAARLAVCLKPFKAGEQDRYFSDDARLCMGRLILFVASAEEFEGRRTLHTVYQLAMEGDRATWEQINEAGLLEFDEQGQPLQDAFGRVVVSDPFQSCEENC